MNTEEMKAYLEEKLRAITQKADEIYEKTPVPFWDNFVYGGTVIGEEALFDVKNSAFQESKEGKSIIAKQAVVMALLKTTQIPIKDTNYLDITLQSRLNGIGAGSWYENMTEEQLLEAITSAELTQFVPEVAMEGCKYYKANIPGKNGITNIEDLPEESPLYLSITHAGTGRLSVSTTEKVPAKDETETTIILGYEKGVGEVMFTMHPGLPIPPSDLTIDKLKEENPELKKAIESKSEELKSQGKDREDVVLQITKDQAKMLGFDMAKLTSDEFGKKLSEQSIDVREAGKGKTDLEKLRAKLLAPLENLEPRERAVLEKRYGLIDGNALSYEEVAKEFKVTRERIRQIEARALGHLRHPRNRRVNVEKNTKDDRTEIDE